MTKEKGVIYILTNPSFPQYIKIGYATDIKQRIDELNRSTAVPFAFRIYATYLSGFRTDPRNCFAICEVESALYRLATGRHLHFPQRVSPVPIDQ